MQQLRQLKAREAELRLQLRGISAQDHFAKYCRTERELDKVAAELQQLGKETTKSATHWGSIPCSVWSPLADVLIPTCCLLLFKRRR